MRRWSTFTPPGHAAGTARCDLFLLRHSYLGKKAFRVVVLGDNGKVPEEESQPEAIDYRHSEPEECCLNLSRNLLPHTGISR